VTQQTSRQEATAVFDPSAHPRRLNLGSGFDYREGFLNVDLNAFHKPDLVADVRRLDQLPSGFYDEVVAEDVLEHLGRTETLTTLSEWSRLLRIGGTLRLRVPDLVGLLNLISDRQRQSVEEQERLVRCLFGTQNYTGDYHHTGFTEVLLRHYLEQTGFSQLAIRHRDGWLFDVEATKLRAPAERAAPASAALPEAAYRVRWIAVDVPSQVTSDTSFECRVRLQNAGEHAWPASSVFISYHWLDGRRLLHWDGDRTPFPDDVEPGATVGAPLVVRAPDAAGTLTLEFTLVHEAVAWFEQKGALTMQKPVTVVRRVAGS